MSEVHFDRAALEAAARFCERNGEAGQHHAEKIRQAVAAHNALADRFLNDTADYRGRLGTLSGRS